MSGSVHLIAWHDWRRADVLAWHDAMFAAAGPGPVTVAFFPTPFGDDANWTERFAGLLRKRYAAEVRPVRLLRDPTPAAELHEILGNAQLFYFTGGDQHLLMQPERRDLAREIRRRIKAGAVAGGFSAGAIAIGPCWPDWPDPLQSELPEEGAKLVRGLGLQQRCIFDFHAEDDGWEELKACLRLLAAQDPKQTHYGCGVPTHGAARVLAAGAVEILGDPGPWFASGPDGVREIQAPEFARS